MAAYVGEAHHLIQEIGDVKIEQIGREENSHANSLATAIESKLRREVLVDYQSEPSIGGR